MPKGSNYVLFDTPDPRHFAWIKGTAATWEALGGKWAPNPDYGRSIVKEYLTDLLATPAPKPEPEEDWKALVLAAEEKLTRIREIVA